MADETQDPTLARLLERLARIEKEREEVLIAIRVIGGDDVQLPPSGNSGEERPTPAQPPLGAGSRRGVDVRPDTFFGLSQHKAARRYLQAVGHADTLENIVRAITAGGVAIGGANPIETLRATLGQNTSVFVRVGPGTFGLRDFYPHLGNRSEPRAKTRAAPKKKRATSAKPEKKSSPVSESQ